jgi:hypothetical protein
MTQRVWSRSRQILGRRTSDRSKGFRRNAVIYWRVDVFRRGAGAECAKGDPKD